MRTGRALLLKGRFKEAVDEFKRAVKISGRSANAHRGLGIAYKQLGRKGDSLRHYKRYLALSPNAPDADAIREEIAELQGGQ